MKNKILILIFTFITLICGFSQDNAVNSWKWVEQTKPTIVYPSYPFGACLITVTDTLNQPRFPDFIIGEQSQSSTSKRKVDSFKINRFETTYAIWYPVRLWAESNGYVFQNPGQEGSSGRRGRAPTDKGKFEPVTTINWRDAVIWCNALSELLNLTPCYTYKGVVLKDSTDGATLDLAECDFSANGYRLPTETEWEYAARKTQIGFQRGDLPSGSVKEDGSSTSLINEDTLAWTSNNTIKTRTVGTTGAPQSPYGNYSQYDFPGIGKANALGIFDMSGNVLEFCWDWYDDYKDVPPNTRAVGPEFGNERVCRGGSWSPYSSFILAGDRYSFDPDEAYNYMGFRFCRSLTTQDYTNPENLKNEEVIVLPLD